MPSTDTATCDTSTAAVVVTITGWHDPIVDTNGHHPRSLYVEECYLPIIGPTASWVYRKLTDRLDRHSDGYLIDLTTLATEMGLSYRPERDSSPFARAIGRLEMFGLAHAIPNGYTVRRRLPQLPIRHVRRLPAEVQRRHHQLVAETVELDALNRAHAIAVAMADAGDTVDRIEHQLAAIGVSPAVAEAVAAKLTAQDNR